PVRHTHSDRRAERGRGDVDREHADRSGGDSRQASGVRRHAGATHHRHHYRPRRAAPAVRGVHTKYSARLIAAFWFGAGAFLIIAAGAAFKAASPMYAANVVGSMLTRWHYIALGAPLLLVAIEWRRLRTPVIAVVFVAIILATFEALIDIRLHQMRTAMNMRHFGMLHGISSMLLLLQVIAAAAAVVANEAAEGGAQAAAQTAAQTAGSE